MNKKIILDLNISSDITNKFVNDLKEDIQQFKENIKDEFGKSLLNIMEKHSKDKKYLYFIYNLFQPNMISLNFPQIDSKFFSSFNFFYHMLKYNIFDDGILYFSKITINTKVKFDRKNDHNYSIKRYFFTDFSHEENKEKINEYVRNYLETISMYKLINYKVNQIYIGINNNKNLFKILDEYDNINNFDNDEDLDENGDLIFLDSVHFNEERAFEKYFHGV